MPDGQRILGAANDKTVRMWLLDGTLENTFVVLHTNKVMALVTLLDNQHALSASLDATVQLFNVRAGAVLRTFIHGTSGCGAWRCCRRPPLRRRLGGQTARIIEHGLAPRWAMRPVVGVLASGSCAGPYCNGGRSAQARGAADHHACGPRS